MTSTTHQPQQEVSGTVADRLSMAFYVGVAGVALAGQISAAEKLALPMLVAVPGMALLELGGVALAARADFRRRKGESALAARVLSGVVAVFGTGFNWFGHKDTSLFAASALAFMSALGYLVWLINSGDRRRDQLRAEGKLPPTPPVYGLVQWFRKPWLTRRARALALVNPDLGLYGSLAAANTAVRVEQRQAAIAKALQAKLTASIDPTTAAIAIATYDLDVIAARLAAEADYDGLTALLAAEMTPVLMTATAKAVATRKAATTQPGKTCPEGCTCGKHTPRKVSRRTRGTKRNPVKQPSNAVPSPAVPTLVIPTLQDLAALRSRA